MRDKLTELIKQAEKQECLNTVCGDIDSLIDSPRGTEFIADHLLANGVIVPPCKVGQKVWCIVDGVSFNPLEASIYSITIQAEGIIMRCGVKGYYGVSYMATDFGKKFFASKEEAEQALSLNSSKEVIL